MKKRLTLRKALDELLTPHGLLLAGLLISMLAWLVPGESIYLRGFAERADVSFPGAALLVAFYAVCAALAWVFFRLGRRYAPRVDIAETENQAVDSRVVYLLTLLALIGVGYVVVRAGGPIAFVEAMARNQANLLKSAIGEGVGIATLRYTTTVAAPIAIHRFFSQRRGVTLAILNLALLLVTSIVASRLSLLMAVVVGAFLFLRMPVRLRGAWWWVGGAGAFVCLALVFLNHVRNAGFYEERGVDNAFASAFYQGLTYLGTPFQVGIGTATAFVADPALFIDGARGSIWSILLPSFLSPDVLPAAEGAVRYHGVVNVSGALTTNSAFADVLYVYGPVGFVALVVWIAIYAALFGALAQRRGYALAAAGVILYAFAEFWRIFLMNQGIALYAIIVTLLAVLVATLATRHKKVDAALAGVRL